MLGEYNSEWGNPKGVVFSLGLPINTEGLEQYFDRFDTISHPHGDFYRGTNKDGEILIVETAPGNASTFRFQEFLYSGPAEYGIGVGFAGAKSDIRRKVIIPSRADFFPELESYEPIYNGIASKELVESIRKECSNSHIYSQEGTIYSIPVSRNLPAAQKFARSLMVNGEYDAVDCETPLFYHLANKNNKQVASILVPSDLPDGSFSNWAWEMLPKITEVVVKSIYKMDSL